MNTSIRQRCRSSALAAIALVTLAGLLVGAEGPPSSPLASRRASAVAPDASVCGGQASFCGAVLRIESDNGTIGSVAAGAHYGPAWGIPPTPNDTTGTGWCVDDTHTGFPAGTIVSLPTPTEWRIRDRRIAATIITLYGGDRVLPYQPFEIDESGELVAAGVTSASPTQLRHVAVWLALRSVLPDPAGTPRIDLASATTFTDRAGRIPSAIGNAAIPIARRMVAIATAMTPIGGDPVVTVEADDGAGPTAPGEPEQLLVRVTDPAGRPLPHLPVWPDRRANLIVTPLPDEPDPTTAHRNAVLAGWPSFDTVAHRQDAALTDADGIARFTAEVDEADTWSASFTVESATFRLRLFGDDLRAQNNVTLRDDRPTLTSATIDGDARRFYIRVTKTSSDGRIGVAGARFALLDRDGAEIARAETDADGVVDFAFDPTPHPQPYRLRELEAPPGLAPLDTDIEVATPDGSISTDPINPTMVEVENHPALHDLMILKRVLGADSGPDDLTGFEFEVRTSADDSVFATLVTGADGRTPVVAVPAGDYHVAETARPAWWPTDQPFPDPIRVTVPADTDEALVVEFENHHPAPTTTTVPPAPTPPVVPTTTTPPTTTTTTLTTTTTTTTTTAPPAPTTIPPTTIPLATIPPPPDGEPQLPRTGGESWRTGYRVGSLIVLAGSVLYVVPTLGLARPSGRDSRPSRRARARKPGTIATRRAGEGDGSAT